MINANVILFNNILIFRSSTPVSLQPYLHGRKNDTVPMHKRKKKKKEHHVNCKKINVNFNIMEFNESNLKTDNMSLANKNAKRRN